MPIDTNALITVALCLVPLFQQNQRGAVLFLLLLALLLFTWR